ncbi:MAG: preprotein translocase subunit YajC [Actinomycetota bacterium]|nr:preprotein translocase subunit YajC [Actinomycetota bacterium]
MGDLVLFLPFLALFGVIIYMQTRQRKKIQARQAELQAALSVGSPIMLTCGLYGDVAGLDDVTVDVEIAPGVVARFARAAVLEVRTADSHLDDADVDDVSAETPGAIDADRADTPPARPAKPLAHDDPAT